MLDDLYAERRSRNLSKGRRPDWYDVLRPAEGETYVIGGKSGVIRWDGRLARIDYEGELTTLTKLWKRGLGEREWFSLGGEKLFGPGGVYDRVCVSIGYPSSFADEAPSE